MQSGGADCLPVPRLQPLPQPVHQPHQEPDHTQGNTNKLKIPRIKEMSRFLEDQKICPQTTPL